MEESGESSGEEYQLGARTSDPIQVQVLVNNQKQQMEVDTRAVYSIISEATRKSLFSELKVHKTNLKTYTEEPMEIVGNLHVRVTYGNQQAKLVLVVAGGDGPSLCVHNWLKYIRLDWE